MRDLRAFVVHCHELGRDLSPIRARVAGMEVIETPRTPHSHAGCIAGHQAAVAMAQGHGWPAVMVLEDDCAFTDAFSWAQWLTDLEWARTHGYAVLSGGCFSSKNPRVVREGLVAVDRFKSSHCLVYLPAAYDVVQRLTFPMDVMIGVLGAKPVVTVPFVAIQGAAYSGIQCKAVDYTSGYAREQARLLELPSTEAA